MSTVYVPVNLRTFETLMNIFSVHAQNVMKCCLYSKPLAKECGVPELKYSTAWLLKHYCIAFSNIL